MSMKAWEEKVLQAPGAPERVGVIEDELRLAAGLTALREQAGLSQRAVAKLIGVSQPRVAAIERSSNVTIDVLAQYARAVGGHLEVSVVKGQDKVTLLPGGPGTAQARRTSRSSSASRRRAPTPSAAKAAKS
jgi:transcriptional regulator with XRE-family HTH domain